MELNTERYYLAAIPYRDDNDYGFGFVVEGFVGIAHNINAFDPCWVADVMFNEHATKTSRSVWQSRKSFKYQKTALRCAARAMVVLIAQESEVAK